MSGFEHVVVATSLEDAAARVAQLLGAGTSVWRIVDDAPVRLAGSPSPGGPSIAMTGAAGVTIEVFADRDPLLVEAATAMLVQVADRLALAERNHHAARRLADSERIGALGTYAWVAETDELEWTDGLYRTYGYEPGAFVPSYARFLEHIHPDDQDRVRRIHERSMRTGEPFDTEERIVRPDGEVRTLWSIGEVTLDEQGRPAGIVGVCRDVTEQREAERLAADAGLRRQQALELNDNVIQGLISLLWQLDEEADEARAIAEATLAAGRRMMSDLLRDLDEGEGAKLVRETPTQLEPDHKGREVAAGAVPGTRGPTAQRPGSTTGTIQVLIADDVPALRMVLRLRLEQQGQVEVVGEACDGQEAIHLVERLRPDVVVMDLSMPVVDGLEATRRITELAPETRVVLLSGYPSESIADDAKAAGAERYVEKSGDLGGLCDVIVTIARQAAGGS